LHNTYFTLPVLVSMVSNHYGWLYQAQHNWLVLVLLMLAAALVRHSFVARHKALVNRQPVPWRYAVVGVALMLAVAGALMPAPPSASTTARPATLAEVHAIVEQRCVMCHNAQVQQKNVALHTDALIRRHAQAMYQQTVVLKLMPLSNATQITDNERAVIKRWFEAGAP
ncbi:MAG TPA: urate hydroxylase PuuD, partial [Burkholderiaceae bacterium]